MDATEKVSFVDAVDAELHPYGFKRSAKSQEWSRVIALDRQWVHLNFGLAIVNVSAGVEYSDIQAAWRDIPGAVFGTFVMLSSAADSGEKLAPNPSPASVVSDIQRFAMSKLESLRDRDTVIENLKRNDIRNWPVPSYSHRIRLAPLIIAQAGRLEEAVNVAELFLAESRDRDQIVPRYPEFVEALRRRVAT